MSIENEIKFEVSPGDLQKISAARSLQPVNGKFVKRSYLVSTYFDTPKHALKRNGVSLRIRQVGKKRIQTIKVAKDGIALGRAEWEHKLDGDELDFRAARGTALEPLLSKNLRRRLDPIFATRVHRTSVPLRLGKSRIELALDEGQVRAGENSAFLAEVELELKNGAVADLFKAARMVTELVPAKFSLRSKSEQGYDLIADHPVQVTRASRIEIQRKATLAAAFQVIGRSVLHHIAANESAVMGAQSEGVHQMRIGVRRLRAAISIFSKLLRCKQTEMIKRDLKWLAGKLGPVRDLDVLLETKVRPFTSAEPSIVGLPDLMRELEYRRDIAAEAAKVAVASSRYRILIFNALEWIENGAWQTHSAGNRRVKSFAVQLFRRRAKKTRRRAKKLQRLNVKDRHKLRIAVKKLRYAIYFFESLFGASREKPLTRYKKYLARLQNDLGALNDHAVHHKLLSKFGTDGEPDKSRLIAFAAGTAMGNDNVKPIAKLAGKAVRKLRHAEAFWV